MNRILIFTVRWRLPLLGSLIMLFTGCGPETEVSPIVLGTAELHPGQTTDVAIEVSNPPRSGQLTYQWTGGGQGAGFDGAARTTGRGKFTAPREPGEYTIACQVMQGEKPVGPLRQVRITVRSDGQHSERAAPTAEPTGMSKPADTQGLPATSPTSGTPQLPASRSYYEVDENFTPSGWMGDGEGKDGKHYVSVDPRAIDSPLTEYGPTCEKWVYDPDDEAIGWAAVGYQFPENNWGEKKGKDLSGRGYTRVTFWARGLNGGERVQFKAGGHTKPDARYPASFEADSDFITLTNSWRQYSIDLSGKNLSNVICAFVWVVRQADNDGKVVFYLDSIRYE